MKQPPSESQGPGHETRDAYWRVRDITYVPENPGSTTSLFDDPVRLSETWSAALASLRAEATQSPEVRAGIAQQAQELLGRVGLQA